MRDTLASTRRANFLERKQRERENMTVSDVESGMEKVIRDRISDGETIGLDDFRRANLPLGIVNDRFKAVLARVRETAA